MPRKRQTRATELTFTEPELEALRAIVTDWINEALAVPPYPPEFDSVIEKLDLPEDEVAPRQQPEPLQANLG